MSRPALSLLVFSVYVFILGAMLIIAPGVLCGWLGIPPAQDYWVRMTGMTLAGLSFYYAFAAIKNWVEFFWLTCAVRMAVIFFLAALAFFRIIPPPLLILGAIDFFFALWTLLTLTNQQAR